MPRKTGQPHKDYLKNLPKWNLINDICDSENLKKYLPRLNPLDKSEDNDIINDNYFNRAVFYEIAGYTSSGLSGLPFSKWPKLEVPDGLKYIEKNISGKGDSIYQQSQSVISSVGRIGRDGLFVEFPDTEGKQLSIRDIEKKKYFATIKKIEARNIIYWEESQIGAEYRLSRIEIIDRIEETEVEDEIDILTVLLLKTDEMGENPTYYNQ